MAQVRQALRLVKLVGEERDMLDQVCLYSLLVVSDFRPPPSLRLSSLLATSVRARNGWSRQLCMLSLTRDLT
eukprot:187497-Hanusia_phi.AAC.3